MKKKNKIVAMLLVMVMAVGVFAVAPVSAGAYSAHTQAEALAWVQSQVGQGIGSGECVALITAYYSYLGVSPVSGNGSDYTWNALPDGWSRLQGAQPQPGDILVYTGGYNNYGHVAIYESDYVTYHQNFGGARSVARVTYKYNGINNPYWGVIRPDFSGSTKTGIDFGDDFYGLVLNSAAWKPIGQDDNNNLVAMSGTSLNEHKIRWHFVKVNSNNGYRIFSTYNGRYWDVSNASSEAGANIQTYPYHDNPAQIWYFQYRENKLTLTAECSNCVVDFTLGSTEDGSNVMMWTYNGTSAQGLSIYSFNDKCGINYEKEFYAIIRNVTSSKPIAQTENGNVELTTETMNNYDKTIWHFSRENNINMYRISSLYNGRYLDVDGAANADETNVHCWNYNDNPAQRWYIQKRRDCVALTAECSTRYLDLKGGKIADGTNVQMYTFNNSAAQNFTIEILDSNQLDFIPEITSEEQALGVNFSTAIHVNGTKYAYNYKFHIINPDGEETVVDNQCNSTFTFIPEQTGQYQIYAEVKNPYYVKSGLEDNQTVTILSCGTGDANFDGATNIRDVTALQRHIADVEFLSDGQLTIADANGDGVVDINDATHLQRYVAEFDVQL